MFPRILASRILTSILILKPNGQDNLFRAYAPIYVNAFLYSASFVAFNSLSANLTKWSNTQTVRWR